MLGPIEQNLVIFSMFILMLGMGTTMSIQEFKNLIREPKQLMIGCTIQFAVMPLLSFLIANYFQLSKEEILALIMVGCTPGGTSSNMFTWFARGKTSLSIAMTLCSTLLAIVLMPALISFYGNQSSIKIQIPIKDISVSIFFVLIPISIGIALKIWNVSFIPQLQKLGSLLGVAATILMLSLWLPKMFEQYQKSESKAYLAILVLGSLGYFFGYWMARSLRLPIDVCRTISLETGLQNTLLTFTIISLSFSTSFLDQVGWIPLVYGSIIMGFGAIVVVLFRWENKFFSI